MKALSQALLVLVFFVSCGGSVNNVDQSETDQTESISSDAIVISSITGDGSTADRFEDEIYVTGENFTDDMTVDLVSDAASFSMAYDFESDTNITAQLPTNLVEGTYELTLANTRAKASATVTILQGEAGISIAEQYHCGWSNDLASSDDETRNGMSTDVTKFSDGSYMITCLVTYSKFSFLSEDTSSDTRWFAYDSTSVQSGELYCLPFYVTAYYFPADNVVVYANQADYSQYETVACSQSYP